MTAQRKRRRQRSNAPQRRTWWWIGIGSVSIIAVIVAVVVAITSSGSKAPESASIARSGAVNSTFDFPITLYQGEETAGSKDDLRFSDLLGDKPIVLNYWASNCPPCSAEMPYFEKVWQKYSDRVLFFGMDIGWLAGFGGPEESKRELKSLGITYMAGPIPDIETIRSLQVRTLPTTDFLTSDGTVQRQWAGPLDEAKLTELVENLLDAS